jgi:hypothetical protein
MSEMSKVYTVRSNSFGRDFGKFYAKNTGDDFTVYNGSGDVQGRYNSMATAEAIAENMARKQAEMIKYRLNSAPLSELNKLGSDENFLDKNMDCMIGGFCILNGRPADSKMKAFYLAYQGSAEIRFVYDSYKAAFADLVTLHTVKDFEVYSS